MRKTLAALILLALTGCAPGAKVQLADGSSVRCSMVVQLKILPGDAWTKGGRKLSPEWCARYLYEMREETVKFRVRDRDETDAEARHFAETHIRCATVCE